MTELARNIKTYMNIQGIKQRELAKRAGITEVTVSRYIHGQRIPSGIILERIAKSLNTTPDNLLGVKKNKDYVSDMLTIKELLSKNKDNMSKNDKMTILEILL